MSADATIPEYVFWYKESELKKGEKTPKDVEKFAKTSDFREKQADTLNDETFSAFLANEGLQQFMKIYARPASKAEIAERAKYESVRDAIENIRDAEKTFKSERDIQRAAIRDWAIDNCVDVEDFNELIKSVPTYTYTSYNNIFCDHTLNEDKKFSKAQIKAWLEEVNTRRHNLTKKLIPLPEAEFIAAFSYTPADKSEDATTAMNTLIKAYAKPVATVTEEEADSE